MNIDYGKESWEFNYDGDKRKKVIFKDCANCGLDKLKNFAHCGFSVIVLGYESEESVGRFLEEKKARRSLKEKLPPSKSWGKFCSNDAPIFIKVESFRWEKSEEIGETKKCEKSFGENF